jgi:hypothetical protein
MKIAKICAVVAAALLSLVGCNNSSSNGETLGNIDNEWQLISVNGEEVPFEVYLSLYDGMFSIYQQVYTLDYKYFDGEYTVKGTTISGEYYDAGEWKCTYTGGISEDGNTLTLKSNETNPVTCVYKACEIPQQIKDEALNGTRGVEVTPFL